VAHSFGGRKSAPCKEVVGNGGKEGGAVHVHIYLVAGAQKKESQFATSRRKPPPPKKKNNPARTRLGKGAHPSKKERLCISARGEKRNRDEDVES